MVSTLTTQDKMTELMLKIPKHQDSGRETVKASFTIHLGVDGPLNSYSAN